MDKSKVVSLGDIENAYDVEKITLNGECVWPVLRFKLNEQLRSLSGVKPRTLQVNNKLIAKAVKSLFYGFHEFFRFRKYEFWVFSASDRRKLLNGVYVDRVAEPFATKFEDSLIIENPFPLGFHYSKKDVPQCNIVSQTPFFVLVMIIKFFSKKRFDIENEEILMKIMEDTGLNFNYQALIRTYLAQYRSMRWLLGIKIPKVACFVYAASSMGFIKALKEKGVPVVEIQHGIINASHTAYNYPKDFGNRLTPDYLFTYGTKEHEIFGKNNHFISSDAVFAVGYYYLDEICKNRPNTDFNSLLYKKYKKIVVCSLQDPFEEYMFPFLEQVALLDTSICYLLIPRNAHKSYESFSLEDNLFIVKDLNIYECLQFADFHVTINSSCAIESLFFGVPNILFDYEGWACSYFQNILNDQKHTVMVKSAKEFITAIYSHDFYQKTEIIDKSRQFIERDFSENITYVINEKVLGTLNE